MYVFQSDTKSKLNLECSEENVTNQIKHQSNQNMILNIWFIDRKLIEIIIKIVEHLLLARQVYIALDFKFIAYLRRTHILQYVGHCFAAKLKQIMDV